ncbi:RNA-directed DNA polymerase, eukaryota [Tanacetum coccineum]
MTGVSSFKSYPSAWTWVFGKNKNLNAKRIDNPFEKDVDKIATSFFVTNFPESLDAKGLWKEFQPFGRIVDAFIANKRSKIGKRFGFVRFLGVNNADTFVNRLSSIWMGSYHVFVSVAKFQRKNKTDKIPTNKDFPHLKKPNVTQFRNPVGSDKPSFASVASGGGGVNRNQNNVNQDKGNYITLSEHDLITVDDSSTVVLVKVKEVGSISNMYRICRNEGIDDVKIHYVGGLWVWIQFNNAKSCEAFKSNKALQNVWTTIRAASTSFIVDERMVWIEITDDNMSLGRICIATNKPFIVAETVKVTIRGVTFDAHVKEISTWNTTIENDLECSDSEGAHEDDVLSFNMEENHNKVLDEFIEQVGETKSTFPKNEVQDNVKVGDHEVSNDTGSKPPGFETKINEETIPDVKPHEVEEMRGNVNQVSSKMEEDARVNSSGSIPPGFENFGTTCNGVSPSNRSRSSKCSTSFGNLKSKDKKGFSFINEMNKMIEVGDSLGYDVKGCKRSFRKMINGIGIQETMASKLELFHLKSKWGNFKFDYACSMARGKWLNSTDNYYLINVYGPQHQPDKANLWESLRIFAHQHVGHIILFVDLNEVRHENESFRTTFSSNDALIFNSFIDNVGLIDLPLGGKIYLDSIVSLEEIKDVVWDCGSQKAPVHYKIIAKILANQLSKVIDSIISPEQSAFISGRQILDGPLILSKVIDWYKKRKKKMMLFKVDFEKAFDSRGLRQGDPLSPFHFIIVMEGLNIMLKDGLAANLFRGIKIGSSSVHISHLFYAYDVIIFSKWNQSDMDNIIRILDVFFLDYGLNITSTRSNLYGGGEVSAVVVLKAFNMSLLLKWRWRLLKYLSALWVKVVKSIHGDEGGFELIGCQSSGLWARIVDYWLGDVPLCSRFNRLFHLDRDKNCLVKDRFVTGAWSWNWFRPINGGRALADLNSLLMELGSITLSNKADSVSSSLSSGGSYSVSDVRKHIDDCLLLNPLPCTRWCKVIPRKVKIYMWRLFLDRLPHRLNLSLRGLDIDSIMCPLCNNHVESNAHVFFSCDIARDVWSLVRGLMVNTRQTGDQPNIATLIAEQLQNIIPQIVNQVTANVNNAQNANGDPRNKMGREVQWHLLVGLRK